MDDREVKVYSDVKKCVDEVIQYIGKDLKFAMPLALGKPVIFINELYRRAKEDPTIKLTILTALPLEIPKPKSQLETRVMKSLIPRLFEGVPQLQYMVDFRDGTMPDNVQPFEFFSKAGSYLNDQMPQQNHIDSNYTHVVRDAFDRGINVFANMISVRDVYGQHLYSMGCNTDIVVEGIEMVEKWRNRGEKILLIGEANPNLPFMYGDAVTDGFQYDYILEGPDFDYQLFGAPKDPVSIPDYMIGIHTSTLIRDAGTLQVGIGALGDAIVAGLIIRNEHNEVYKDILNITGISRRYGKLIREWGGVGVFKEGLYGSSEMFVGAFMQLYKSKILKRKVFDSVPLMKLINEGYMTADYIPEDIIDCLIEMKAIHSVLDLDDFYFLLGYGILDGDLRFENNAIWDGETSYSADLNDEKDRLAIRKLLGKSLKNGKVILGAFFVGPKSFYKALNDMSEEERQLFGMSGVEKVNQLYGDEELRSLQRKDGRFVNTGMVATLMGNIASDMLEDGRVVSGVGGQYNFVSMGHALPDGRVIMLIKSVKGMGKMLRSNIVWTYGHCTVPKHLRDIVVTEYGIADVRGKSDKEVIMELLNIADSRFQDSLLAQAKKSGKIPKDYEIPEEYRNNTPEKLKAMLAPYQAKGFFPAYPFGTDFSKDDIELVGSLKALQKTVKGYPLKVVKGLLKEVFQPIPASVQHHLLRMELFAPRTFFEKLLRKLVVLALRMNGYI
ncbi:MAG: acetyl-CoA hydrolase/transferase C-terminal domain-containing protein [Ignavibacteriales bacterium]